MESSRKELISTLELALIGVHLNRDSLFRIVGTLSVSRFIGIDKAPIAMLQERFMKDDVLGIAFNHYRIIENFISIFPPKQNDDIDNIYKKYPYDFSLVVCISELLHERSE